ncbi:MAG: hypothetical protein MPK31_02315 [Gammaproteobacteria bacterium]|nr:hypothetical protein [Gammaproteobacteria bacterium]
MQKNFAEFFACFLFFRRDFRREFFIFVRIARRRAQKNLREKSPVAREKYREKRREYAVFAANFRAPAPAQNARLRYNSPPRTPPEAQIVHPKTRIRQKRTAQLRARPPVRPRQRAVAAARHADV